MSCTVPCTENETCFYRFMKSVVIPIGKAAMFDPVIEVGFEKFPGRGQAAVCAFLHHNDFADLALTIGASPRYVRFGAAAYLWKVPVLGCFPPALGAVPLARAGESSAGSSQAASFDKLVSTLCDGGCLMLAPEGGSRMRTMVGEFKKGWVHFAEQAVFHKTIKDTEVDESFSVSLVPIGVVYMQFNLWRSAAMVRCGDPITINAEKLRAAGVTADMKDDDRVRKQLVNMLLEEFKPAMERVSMHIPPKPCPPDDPNKASILEGSFAALRLAVVASRLAWFESEGNARLPPMDLWCDSIVKSAEALNSDDDLWKRMDKYHRELVHTGVRDAQVRSNASPGSRQLCGFACLCLLFLILLPVFSLALPACILWSPMFLLGWCGTRAKFKRGLKYYKTPEPGSKERPDPRFQDGDVMRRRADFDTIPRVKGGPSFFYLPLLLIIMWTLLSVYFTRQGWSLGSGIGLGFAFGFLGLLLKLWLSFRLLDEAFALLRAICGRWAMFRIPAGKLMQIRQERAELRKVILAIEGMRNIVESRSDAPGINCLLGRCLRSDWMEAISLSEDLKLSFCDFNDPPHAGAHEDYEALS
mmetsp:Transcript_136275/g.236955  ORF Transcript_136275/g.236955 Transcript_136275/m.236955 type:complete len:585 (+) Transcript_136275:80-1834(+)